MCIPHASARGNAGGAEPQSPQENQMAPPTSTTMEPIATDLVARNAAAVRAYAEAHDTSFLRPDATFVDVTSGLRWQGHEAIAGMLDYFYRIAFDAHVEDTRMIVGLDGAVLEATF